MNRWHFHRERAAAKLGNPRAGLRVYDRILGLQQGWKAVTNRKPMPCRLHFP